MVTTDLGNLGCAVTELVHRWHWTEGNGALPFPGRRVESTYPGFSGMVYEIREYLGNEMIVSYREAFSNHLPHFRDESARWRYVEARFLEYLEDPRG